MAISGMQFIPMKDHKSYEWIQAFLGLSELSSTDKNVLIYLASRAGQDGSCYPSLLTIADAVGTTDRTVKRSLAKAKEAGLLVWTQRKTSEGWVNSYTFTYSEELLELLRGEDTDVPTPTVDGTTPQANEPEGKDILGGGKDTGVLQITKENNNQESNSYMNNKNSIKRHILITNTISKSIRAFRNQKAEEVPLEEKPKERKALPLHGRSQHGEFSMNNPKQPPQDGKEYFWNARSNTWIPTVREELKDCDVGAY